MSFEVSRLRRSDRVVALGAIALFVFMFFFKWFGASVSGTSPLNGASFSVSSSANAWHTLSNTRWLLLLTVIVALGAVVLVATRRELSLPVAPSAIVAGLGGLSAIFVLYRIIDHPSGGGSAAFASYSYGAKAGLYLGFLACLAIAYGGYLAMNEEGTTIGDVREQARASFDAVAGSSGSADSSGLSGSSGSSTGGETPSPGLGEPPPATPPPAPQL